MWGEQKDRLVRNEPETSVISIFIIMHKMYIDTIEGKLPKNSDFMHTEIIFMFVLMIDLLLVGVDW